MYENFFGFAERPFDLTPNPRYLVLTPSHREALSNLQYGLATGKAVTVLIGEAGTGKTTLLHAAFESELCRHVRYVYINNPSFRDFVVANASYCSGGEIIQLRSVPTRDNPECLVNYCRGRGGGGGN